MATSNRNSSEQIANAAVPAADSGEYARLVIKNQYGALATKDVLRPTTLIGGQPGCNVHLVSPEVAAAHCVLTREAGGFHVRDLRSAAGTFVDGVRVEVAPISEGSVLRIGPFECRLETNIPSTSSIKAVCAVPGSATAASTLGDAIPTGTARLVIRNRDGAVVRKLISRHNTLIGSIPQANVQLVAPEISPVHCLITLEEQGLRVRDLRSRNGTRVNGSAMETCRLCNGDCLEIGPFVCLLETDIQSTAGEADDRIDRRFHLDVPERPRVGERELIAAEREQLARERAEWEHSRLELERAWESLAQQRAEHDRSLQVLQQSREELDALRSSLNSRETAISRELEELAQQKARNEQEIVAARTSLNATERALDELRIKLERDRHELTVQKTDLERARVSQQAGLKKLAVEQVAHAAAVESLLQDRRAYDASLETLESEKADIGVLRAKLDTDALDLAKRQADLKRQQADFDSRHAQLDSANKQLETQFAQLAAKQKEFADERKRFDEQVRSHDLEHQRLTGENERSRVLAERLAHDLAELEEQKANLLAQMQRLAADSDALRSDKAQLNAAFSALDSERRSIEKERARIDEREAALNAESTRIDELRLQLQHDIARLEGEENAAAAERAHLAGELQEVSAILAQLRIDRETFADDRHAIELERAELAAERTRLSQQQAAVTAALVQLEERNEEIQYRRERLKAEQAFLRSGKQQFQGALDEFRAEQARFRQAVTAVKSMRKGFTRRRESRAELHAIRAAGCAIPMRTEWILDRELEGLSEEDGTLLGLLDASHIHRIYVLEDRRTGRRLAVKLASPLRYSAEQLDQIEQSWQFALGSKQPELVQTMRVDRYNGFVRIFMEYVESINIRELMQLHGALAWREAASYGFQAALALEKYHEAGRPHGRVHPSHLIIEVDGTLRLLPSRGGSDNYAAGSAGAGAGTPEFADYIPPEVLRGGSPADIRSDLYQLGCVLYHAIAGHPAFPVATTAEKLDCHATRLPAPLRRAHIDLPKDLVLAIKTLMAKQPAERYRSATEAAEALAPFARRRPAWFSFESVLCARAERMSARVADGVSELLERLPASVPGEIS